MSRLPICNCETHKACTAGVACRRLSLFKPVPLLLSGGPSTSPQVTDFLKSASASRRLTRSSKTLLCTCSTSSSNSSLPIPSQAENQASLERKRSLARSWAEGVVDPPVRGGFKFGDDKARRQTLLNVEEAVRGGRPTSSATLEATLPQLLPDLLKLCGDSLGQAGELCTTSWLALSASGGILGLFGWAGLSKVFCWYCARRFM